MKFKLNEENESIQPLSKDTIVAYSKYPDTWDSLKNIRVCKLDDIVWDNSRLWIQVVKLDADEPTAVVKIDGQWYDFVPGIHSKLGTSKAVMVKQIRDKVRNEYKIPFNKNEYRYIKTTPLKDGSTVSVKIDPPSMSVKDISDAYVVVMTNWEKRHIKPFKLNSIERSLNTVEELDRVMEIFNSFTPDMTYEEVSDVIDKNK